MNETEIREGIQTLIDNLEVVKQKKLYNKFNEEDTKKNFILPLFKTLGWDTENYDEVKAEEKVSKKRVDYAFRINGMTKFYVEAKSLKEDINNVKYAKQAIEYAWNKSITWAILTNFEEIKVFNAEWKWDEKKPLRNQFIHLKAHDLLNSNFKFLLWLTRENIEKGVLNEQAEIFGKKLKKLPISDQLLSDFTEYRTLLSKDILKNNTAFNLSQDELDEIVQRLLDRIIFIRTCEDKEIESEKLESLVRIYGNKKGKLDKELNKRFREVDKGYNSKLFSEHICENVEIDSDVLSRVILGTYRSKDLDIGYDFSAIDADVLGNIYEQYLGHILKKTTKRAKLTNGKVHRKEHGIYYTPTYIVDFIVKNTINSLLRDKNVSLDGLKILDPSCGSGSFLIKSYDVLSEYITKKEGRTQQTRFENAFSEDTKILKRKTEILKNCIHGVDIDQQAVEIAQLNLLLKLAEKRHRLPTLKGNVKCGNSLINDPGIAGAKAFDWESEFFNNFNNDKFNVIVGNPPYINVYLMNKQEREYFNNSEKYISTHLKYDIYILFIEKALSLLGDKGYLGFIIPYSVLNQPYAIILRKLILDTCRIVTIVDLSNYYVFHDASVKTCIVILQKEENKRKRNSNKIEIIFQDEYVGNIDRGKSKINSIKQSLYYKTPYNMFRLQITEDILKLTDKIKIKSVLMGTLCYVSKGIVAYSKIDDRKKKDFISHEKITDKSVAYLEGKDVGRYEINYKNIFLDYDQNIMSRPTFPELHINKKIIVRAMTNGLISTFDEGGFFSDQKLILCSKRNIIEEHIISSKKPKEKKANDIEKYDERFIVALLNSKLMGFYYEFLVFGGLSILPQDIREFPIKKINFNDEKDLKFHNDLVEYVKIILSLKEKLREFDKKKTDESVEIKNKIIDYSNKIDDLVYDLYNLTDDEIITVENSMKP